VTIHVFVYRARRAEARIQQMLWKVNYSDIVFINTVRVTYARGAAWYRAACCVIFAVTWRNMPQYAARRKAQIVHVEKFAYELTALALKLSKR